MQAQIGITIPPCDEARRVADAVRLAEDVGLDSAWLFDAQLVWRDIYATMALAADRTERIRLAPGIALTTARHPTVVASAINTIQELAPGRVGLGLGTGGLDYFIGEPSRKRAQLRQDVEIIRALLSGESYDLRPRGYDIHLIAAAGAVPIYLSAGGPRIAELAGEVADGVILSVGACPELLQTMLESVQVGLDRAGRSRDDFEVICTYFMHVSDDIERDLPLLKPTVCALASNTGGKRPSPMSAGLFSAAAADLPDPDKHPKGFFPSIGFSPDRAEAIRICGPAVTDETARRIAAIGGLFGDGDEIARRIDLMTAAGADHHSAVGIEAHKLPITEIDVLGQIKSRLAQATTV